MRRRPIPLLVPLLALSGSLAAAGEPEPAARELTVEGRYLHLPIGRGAPPRRMRIEAGGRVAREFDIKLAEGRPDFRVFDDVDPFRGERLRIEADAPPGALGQITQAQEVPGADELYREARRPQFHFTSRRGWLNDPNGLLWHDGEYHLFYQHNPYGWDWGNMHWGHAVSPDLIHWTELPIALRPRRYGDWCFSGSGVVDERNTSGFGAGGAPPLVIAFTSTGRGECIAFSNDRGRTWAEYEGNPVIKHRGRDPRLLRHAPTGRWVMAVYDEADDRRSIAFYTSPDLKAWTYESRIDGFYECPDLFELPVEGAPGEARWVLSGADGEYLLGRFDGRRFEPGSGKHRTWHGDFYAAQTFSNEPEGRRVQIGWARGIDFPGMPFNQQMTVPCALTLRRTGEGVRLFARPVRELDALRGNAQARTDLGLTPDAQPLAGTEGELLDIDLTAEVGASGSFTLRARGVPIRYDAGRGILSCGPHSAPLATEGGRVLLRILIDRGSIEVFGNDGRAAISCGIPPREGDRRGPMTAAGAGATLRSVTAHELASAWR